MKEDMKFWNDEVEALCGDFADAFNTRIVQNNVKYLYWRTDNTEYVAAFCDTKYVDGKTGDVRFYRIWKRKFDVHPNGAWEFFVADFLFGASNTYPIEMFVEEVEDKDKVTCAIEMNEWQFETVMVSFRRQLKR